MRLEGWNPNKFDETFENIAIERLVEAAEVVATKARNNCHVGTIARPVYKSGKDAGKFWTARDPGNLKKSIRVVRKKTKSGRAFSRKRNVRIYAGNKKAYYARWMEIEYGTSKSPAKPFLRPAFYSSMPEIKSILGVR